MFSCHHSVSCEMQNHPPLNIFFYLHLIQMVASYITFRLINNSLISWLFGLHAEGSIIIFHSTILALSRENLHANNNEADQHVFVCFVALRSKSSTACVILDNTEKIQQKFKLSFEYFWKYYWKWSKCSKRANVPFAIIFQIHDISKALLWSKGLTFLIFKIH